MILLSPDATSDIERVREFLDIHNPDVARRALDVIWAALEKVQEFPDLGHRRRIWKFARSSYASASRAIFCDTRSCLKAAMCSYFAFGMAEKREREGKSRQKPNMLRLPSLPHRNVDACLAIHVSPCLSK